jgi:hypothetical protein
VAARAHRQHAAQPLVLQALDGRGRLAQKLGRAGRLRIHTTTISDRLESTPAEKIRCPMP